jgi:hypothetical protein
MKIDFICPKCQGYLSVGNRVIFTIKKKNWSGGIVMLSPVLGEYTFTTNPTVQVEEGEEYDFYCPICQHDLSVVGHDKMARVIMREDNEEFFIVFSKKKGEKCTYKLSESKLESYFGEHATPHFDVSSLTMMK